MNALTAVTHDDPYPYYASLPPIFFDNELGMWVASSADTVTSVLTSTLCRVVPEGRSAFGLARLSDGAAHGPLKATAMETIDAFANVSEIAEDWAGRLDLPLEELAYALPVRTLATLLGIGDDLTPLIRECSQAIFGGGAANRLGLLVQSCDATAGLIGNTLLADGPTVEEVLRLDSPVQNTRRYVAEDGVVAGVPMRRGDAIVVVLAAANRDPRANGQIFTFGIGPHACPGQHVAVAIAEAGVRELRRRGVTIPRPVRYRESLNVRIPFGGMRQ
jgi:cytochrome P450